MIPMKVISTGIALPPEKVFSSELDVRLGKPSGAVEKRSGIKYRHFASYTDSHAELAAKAVESALQNGGINPSTVDLLVYASALSIQSLPNSAVHVLKASCLSDGIACIDVNTSCLSFLSGVQMAAGFLNAGVYKRVAVVSAELPSRGLDWGQEEASIIFGDGAACTIFEKGDGVSGIAAFRLESYTDGSEFCRVRAGGTLRTPRSGISDEDFLFYMDGKRVFRMASGLMEDFVDRLFDGTGMSLQDVDVVIPHQASLLGMEHMRKRLKISENKFMNIYNTHGNQVAASIPTAFHYARENGLYGNGPAVMLGTAAGLTLGGMVLLP